MDEDQNHSHEHHDHASHGHSAPAPSQPEPGKAIDPVCGMQVTIKPDARHRDYGGDTFYPALFAEPARRIMRDKRCRRHSRGGAHRV